MDPLVLRGAARSEHPLTLRERVLYHQIHPAKLFADLATALVAIDLFSRSTLPGTADVISGLALFAICWANGIGRHPR